MKLFLIFLQLCLLAFAIYWREKRVKEAPLRRAFKLQNGSIKHTYFTPAHGTKYHDQV